MGLRFFVQAFSPCGEQGLLSSAVHRLLVAGVLTVGQGLKGAWASVSVAHGLSWVETRGVFPEQGWNLCLLPWQAVSLLLDHQGSPCCLFNSQFILIRIQSRSENRL